MSFDLKKILKTLLLSTSEPLSSRDVQDLVKRYHEESVELPEELAEEGQEAEGVETEVPSSITATQIREAAESLNQELELAEEVYRILETPGGYQVATVPAFADWVRLLRKEPKPMKLSQSVMETLALIAYRQPVTRAEMEAIRGVSVDHAITKLVEHELIHVTGRAELPGRPMQYGTTTSFLEFCGIASLEELPASDVLSPQQIKQWITDATQQEISDEDVGLPSDEASAEQLDLPEEVEECAEEEFVAVAAEEE